MVAFTWPSSKRLTRSGQKLGEVINRVGNEQALCFAEETQEETQKETQEEAKEEMTDIEVQAYTRMLRKAVNEMVELSAKIPREATLGNKIERIGKKIQRYLDDQQKYLDLDEQ